MTIELTFDQVPTKEQASSPEWPTSALARTAYRRVARASLSRRRITQAFFVSASLASLNVVSWFGKGVSPAAAYGSCTTEYTASDCSPPYPTNYYDSPNTGCFGSQSIGVTLCGSGRWHRRDYKDVYTTRYYYYRLCGGREVCGSGFAPPLNAWRWSSPTTGLVRCSDGETHVYDRGRFVSQYLSICAQPL